MKKLIFIAVALFSLSLFSQTKTSSPATNFADVFIIVDAGTAMTKNKICQLSVDQNLQGNYWVILTPYNSNSGLFLREKSHSFFIVESSNNAEKFDYFVVTKKNFLNNNTIEKN